MKSGGLELGCFNRQCCGKQQNPMPERMIEVSRHNQSSAWAILSIDLNFVTVGLP
jgi:hypothetical protein